MCIPVRRGPQGEDIFNIFQLVTYSDVRVKSRTLPIFKTQDVRVKSRTLLEGYFYGNLDTKTAEEKPKTLEKAIGNKVNTKVKDNAQNTSFWHSIFDF